MIGLVSCSLARVAAALPKKEWGANPFSLIFARLGVQLDLRGQAPPLLFSAKREMCMMFRYDRYGFPFEKKVRVAKVEVAEKVVEPKTKVESKGEKAVRYFAPDAIDNGKDVVSKVTGDWIDRDAGF